MVEVAVAMSMASTAFNTIKKGIEMGREAQDIAQYFGNWFEAKEQLTEAQQYADNPSLVNKMFSGKSVEAQALQITSAKYKIQAMEKELRDYLLYSGQSDFYEDMMRERRVIREQRFREARKKAEAKKMFLDGIAIITGMLIGAVIVGAGVSLIFY